MRNPLIWRARNPSMTTDLTAPAYRNALKRRQQLAVNGHVAVLAVHGTIDLVVRWLRFVNDDESELVVTHLTQEYIPDDAETAKNHNQSFVGFSRCSALIFGHCCLRKLPAVVGTAKDKKENNDR